MAKKLFATIVVTLPDDCFEAAEVYARLRPAWTTMLDALEGSGAAYETKLQELEQLTKGKRAPRKPRLVPAPEAA